VSGFVGGAGCIASPESAIPIIHTAASKCLTTISSPLAFPVRTLKPGVVGAPRQVFPAAGFLTNFSGSRIFDRRLSHALGVILAGL
jgi:hypothetical protein